MDKMTLDNIIKRVSDMGLNDAMLYLADPRETNFPDGILPSEVVTDITDLLMVKFEDGWGILQELLRDCVNGCTGFEPFRHVEVSTSYDILDSLLISRPKEMVDRTRALYERYEKNDAAKRNFEREVAKGKISDEDLTLIRLSHYTHKWRQFVEKSNQGNGEKTNPFGYLKGDDYRFSRVEHTVKPNPNAGYPHYPVHSTISRIKTQDRVIEKLIRLYIDALMKPSLDGDNGLMTLPVKDYFAARIIGLNWSSKAKVDGILYKKGGRWKVYKTIDQARNPKYTGRDFNNFIYVVYRDDKPDVLLELQFVPLPDTLLADFFAKDRHDAYQIRRKQTVEAYRKHITYGRDYTRMEHNLKRVSQFLAP